MSYLKVCIVGVCCAVGLLFSTTWAPVDKTCPICGTRSTYFEVTSYGSYIYDYPSKYEYVFWPYIDNRVVYACRKCWFSCYAWDFESMPEANRKGIKRICDSIALYETNGDYFVIPMSYRLQVAEKIYRLLDKDDEFWCRFYRVMGYHLAAEKKSEKAGIARAKAVDIAERMLSSPQYIGIRKELYFIIGAMNYLLHNQEQALASFQEAKSLIYDKEQLDRESSANVNSYLNELIAEYIDIIGAIHERKVFFTTTPVIKDLVASPYIFADSMVTVKGMLVNRGKGYFKDFRPALQDEMGNIVPVTSWVPLEVPPSDSQSKVMSYYLGNTVKVSGYVRKDEKNHFGSEYYLEVKKAIIVSE